MKRFKDTSLLVIHQSQRTASELKVLKKWATDSFDDIVCVYKSTGHSPFGAGWQSVSYLFDSDLTQTLNLAFRKIKHDRVFILYSDERVQHVPDEAYAESPGGKACYPAVIFHHAYTNKTNFALRLIPLLDTEGPFNGTVIPDLTEYMNKHDLEISTHSFAIEKKEMFVGQNQLEKTAERPAPHLAMDWYWKGIYHSEKQQHAIAEKSFRKARVLSGDDSLLPFYHTSVINGLATSLAELNKTEEALGLIEESLGINTQQYAPYLIRHKIQWRKEKWQKACEALLDYLPVAGKHSCSNMDFYLNQAEAHFLIAETFLRLNNREDAFFHLEKFFCLNKGDVHPGIKEKLFIYAVELEKEEEATHYFNILFSDTISDTMNEKATIRVLGAISLFEEKGWHQTACELYEALFNTHPHSQKIMRRWLITLMRTGQMQKARQTAKQAMSS